MCAAQVCAQIGSYTWPALLPVFMSEWHLTNREAGWITGVLYAAYAVSVPILVTLTDRVDARRVYLSGVALTDVGNMYGAIRHYKGCKQNGLTPLLGAEMFIPRGGSRTGALQPVPPRS